MAPRFIRIIRFGLVLAVLTILTGCHALRRGDFLQQAEDTLYFSRIGFSVADNSIVNPSLPRDAFVDVKGTSNDVYIQVPYVTDTTVPLVVSFDVVAKDAVVYWSPFGMGTWTLIDSGDTAAPLLFNTGTPEPIDFQIRKTDATTGSIEYSPVFTVRVTKYLRPVILNPSIPNTVAVPFHDLRVGFEDENGDPIPGAAVSAGTWLPGYVPIHNERIDFNSVDPVLYQPAGVPALLFPEGFQFQALPYFPEGHTVDFKPGSFTDPDGYPCDGAELSFEYTPPAIHLSHDGGTFPANDGLSPAEALGSWPDVVAALTTYNTPATIIFDVFVEASVTPYETFGAGLIDPILAPAPGYIRVYGGYRAGFDSRYTADWFDRPDSAHTTFTDTTQGPGGGDLNPSAVFTFSGGVDNDWIFDDIQAAAGDNGGAGANFSSAIFVDNCDPVLNNVTAVASQGNAGVSTSAMTVVGASPIVRESRFFGNALGDAASVSVGIRADSSPFDMGPDCLVAGGDLDGISVGVVAQNGTSIDIHDSIVLSGVVDPDQNNHTELGSVAFNLNGGSLFAVNNVHFLAADATAQSVAISANGAGSIVELWQSTLIAGSAQDSIGFNALNIGDFVMYNTVVLADDSTGGGTSTGVYLENIPAGGTPVRLSGNTIGVRRGDPGLTFGIRLVNTTDVEVHNNLVWSANADDMLGIESNAGPVDRVRHNNFWDDDGDIDLNLDGGGAQPIAYWQDVYPTATTRGNIRLPLSIDTSYGLSSGDFDVGRITGSRPDDVVYGGEDLTGLGSGPPYPPDHDRDGPPPYGRDRTPSAGVGYSMGAYEYGTDSYLPTRIHVATAANGGDDGHPLGTASRPFASLARANDAAQVRMDAAEIRVGSGNYDVSNAPAGRPVADFTHNIRVTGGWNGSFSSRSPRTSILERSDVGRLIGFDTNFVDSAFDFDGFTLRGLGTNDDVMTVTGGAAPDIRNNAIEANPVGGASTTGLRITASNPLVENNDISGGASNDATAVLMDGDAGTRLINNQITTDNGNVNRGIWLINPAVPTTLIQSNSIATGTGTNTRGIYALSVTGTPQIIANTIVAADAGTESTGLFVDSSDLFIQNNSTIQSGNGPDSYGVRFINGSSGTFVDNVVQAGVSGSDSIGLDVDNSTPFVDGNTVRGGGSTDSSFGLRITGTGGDYFNNTFDAGEATNLAYGLYKNGDGPTTLVDNRIAGGTSLSNTSYGALLNAGSQTTMERNLILGGTAPTTHGLRIQGPLPSWINVIGNDIFGGTSSNDSYGVSLMNGDGTSLVNNRIHAGAETGNVIRGLEIQNSAGGSVAVYSNTIYGGRTTGFANSGAIYTQASNPQVVNNILIAGAGPNPPAAYWQQDANTPVRFLNNLLLGVDAAAIAYNMAGMPWFTETDIETNVFGGPTPGIAFGNFARIGENPAVYFNQFRSSGGESEFLGDNWRLSGGGSAPASTGGYDVAANPDGIPVLFLYDFDKDGDFRNPPWSIGAYE